MPSSLCLMLARFALSAWVGAAALFVVASIREQVRPGFDQATRDALALVRFPSYYAFGFALVATALVCLAAARNHPDLGRTRARIGLALVAAALALMAVDYIAIYRPLVEMITPPGRSRPPDFAFRHKASMAVNLLDTALCLAAALMLSLPRRAAGPKTLPEETRAPAPARGGDSQCPGG